MGENPASFPKPTRIKVICDKSLAKITVMEEWETWVSAGLSFALFLHFLFESYPKIQRPYPPGKLGFTVNGMAPLEAYPLKDGDVVEFKAF